jgi:hypothetical protein
MAKIPKTKCPRCSGTGKTTDIPALRDRRKASGLTLLKMSVATGISITHISGAERGRHPAHEPFASRYIAALLEAETKQTKTKTNK